GFGRARRTSVVIGGEIAEGEFALATGLPQEVRVELGRERLRFRDERRRRRSGEAQQHVRCLDLEPFARRRLDLQRGVVVDEDAAGLERAVVLEKDVHRKGKLREKGRGLYRRAKHAL